MLDLGKEMMDVMDESSALHRERDEWRRWCAEISLDLGVDSENLADQMGVLEQWEEMRRRISDKIKLSPSTET